jgi:arylsulfatase A-like enzyme
MAAEHILLITVDSLRYDRVLDHDREAEPGPTISSLAADGTSFTNAYANGPNTPTSFPSILTSTYPIMYGGYEYLDERRPFVSKTLSNAGYRTVGYHSNPHLGPQQNYNHGFDNFNDNEDGNGGQTIKNFVDNKLDPESYLYKVLRRVYHLFSMTTGNSAYIKADTITDRAIEWFEDSWDRGTPYFMWLHYMDVHYPFTPPDEFVEAIGGDPPSTRKAADLNGRMQENPDTLSGAERQQLLDLYDGEIRHMDHHIGRFLDHLATLGVRENTTVVLTADHGEAFGEHDRYGHHEFMYDELLHVPLVFDVPGRDGTTVERQVSLVDIGPTFYDLVGIETPDSVQGESLRPHLDGEATEDRTVIGTSSQGDRLAIRTPEWKCLWHVAEEETELYDIQADPGENQNVSGAYPDICSELREMMEEYVREAESTDTDLPEVEQSEEVKERLEDLGYVD